MIRNIWRETTLLAACERCPIEDLSLLDCDDLSEWETVVELLESAVLWDRDFEMQFVLDADPNDGEELKDELGFEGDFYTAVAYDVPDSQHTLYFDALLGLTPFSHT